MYKGKRVVVTGGSGFVGTHYLEELLLRGANVVTHTHERPLQIQDDRIEVFENLDLENINDCMKLVDGADYVVHSAGKICHPSNVSSDFQVALNQIAVITNVLEASYKSNVKGFVDVNSSTGYPDRRYPITEDEYWDDEPYIAYYGYGWMRRYREKVMEHCSHLTDMKIGIARGTAMFGPYDNFDLKTCHVVPALIKRVLSDENPFIAWGSPDVVRDFTHSVDMARACLDVVEKHAVCDPINIASGNLVTIGESVDLILKYAGHDIKPEYDESKPVTIQYRALDTSKANDVIGYKPTISFEDGIEETVEWIRENM